MAKQDTPSTKHVLDRNIAALNARDIEGYLANQRPDVEFVLSGGVTLHGRDEIRHYIEALWKAFSDPLEMMTQLGLMPAPGSLDKPVA